MDDLTIHIRNISPTTTKEELTMFFSYCGTVDKIKLRRDDDRSQSAFVTFRQPYAVRTSLLLNDAVIGDRHVKIQQAERNISIPIISCSSKNYERSSGGLMPTAQSALQLVTLRGREVLNKARESAIHTGKTVTQQANSAITVAEQTAGGIGSAIMSSSSSVSKGALWLSGMLDRASKGVAELGGTKTRNSNYGRQK